MLVSPHVTKYVVEMEGNGFHFVEDPKAISFI